MKTLLCLLCLIACAVLRAQPAGSLTYGERHRIASAVLQEKRET